MITNRPSYMPDPNAPRSASVYPLPGPASMPGAGGMPFSGPSSLPSGNLPAVIPTQAPVPVPPARPPGFLSGLFGGGGGAAGAGGGGGGGFLSSLGLNNFKLTDIKSMVDRLGGIDGIVSNVTKVQKLMTQVKDMQPMLKLIISSFKKSDDEDDEPVKRPRKRKKRRRRVQSNPLTKVGPKKKRPPRL